MQDELHAILQPLIAPEKQQRPAVPGWEPPDLQSGPVPPSDQSGTGDAVASPVPVEASVQVTASVPPPAEPGAPETTVPLSPASADREAIKAGPQRLGRPERRRRTAREKEPEAGGQPDGVDGLVLAAAKPNVGTVVFRYAARILLVLLLVVGFAQLFVKPFINRADGTTETAAAQVDLDMARQVAARAMTSYFTVVKGREGERRDALAVVFPAANLTGGVATKGSQVEVLTTVPGQVIPVGGAAAVASVAVQLHLAGGSDSQRSAAAAAPKTTGAAPVSTAAAAPKATGTSPVSTERVVWLDLAVPVVLDQGQLVVAASGPVVVGSGALLPVPARDGQDSDAALTEATRGWAKDFFAAYAAGTVQYLAVPDSAIRSVSAPLTLGEVSSWAVSAAGPGGTRTGLATVRWEFADSGVSLTMQYRVVLVLRDGKWLAATVGPTVTPEQAAPAHTTTERAPS